jgi:hypothetical protein
MALRLMASLRSTSSCVPTGKIALTRYQHLEGQLKHSPKEPWHGRHIVALPTSHQIGLENFTVGPTTPPLKFLPIHLPNSFYALRGEGSHTSDGRAPFLVALKSTTGTRTASMAVLYIENPTRGQTWIPDACTEGYECAVDQWNFEDAGTDMVHPNLRFEGFEGRFQPMKDAPHGEGWHVYWKGDAGLRHPIALDLVPI